MPSRRDALASAAAALGALWYGSASCNRVVLERVAREDGGLRIRVGSGPAASKPEHCTDDLAVGDYRVAVTLADSHPERVDVTEALSATRPRRTPSRSTDAAH